MVSGEVLNRTTVKFCECSFPKHVALSLKSEKRWKCEQLLVLHSHGRFSLHDAPFSGKYLLAKACAMSLLNKITTAQLLQYSPESIQILTESILSVPVWVFTFQVTLMLCEDIGSSCTSWGGPSGAGERGKMHQNWPSLPKEFSISHKMSPPLHPSVTEVGISVTWKTLSNKSRARNLLHSGDISGQQQKYMCQKVPIW